MQTKDRSPSNRWSVLFAEKAVLEEFNSIPVDLQASLTHLIEMIQYLGLTAIGLPFVKHVEKDLWELRAKGKSGIARGLYVTGSGRCVYILRVIHKKSARLRRNDIETAMKRAGRIDK